MTTRALNMMVGASLFVLFYIIASVAMMDSGTSLVPKAIQQQIQ